MFAANGISSAAPTILDWGAVTDPSTETLLIVKKAYPPALTTMNVDFAPTLGGGSVQFTGHAPFNNSSSWGPHQIFDGAINTYAWCNLDGVNTKFARLVFPKAVVVSHIYLVPREVSANPTSIAVYADGVLRGTSTPKTISNADGLVITYTGMGHFIAGTIPCTTLELVFSGATTYVQELEIRGH